jgi:hypothetical protein
LKTNLPQRRQERKGLAAKTMLTCLVKTQIRRFFIQNLDFPLLLRVFAVEVLFQLRFLGLIIGEKPAVDNKCTKSHSLRKKLGNYAFRDNCLDASICALFHSPPFLSRQSLRSCQ